MWNWDRYMHTDWITVPQRSYWSPRGKSHSLYVRSINLKRWKTIKMCTYNIPWYVCSVLCVHRGKASAQFHRSSNHRCGGPGSHNHTHTHTHSAGTQTNYQTHNNNESKMNRIIMVIDKQRINLRVPIHLFSFVHVYICVSFIIFAHCWPTMGIIIKTHINL